MNSSSISVKEKIAAWKKRDANYDNLFVLGVKTTGIACRPSCPSQPKPEHIEFFDRLGEALQAGYRPCKRCHPELASGQLPSWVNQLMARTENSIDHKISAQTLREIGVAPEQARRWFQKNYGMTFTAWCRGLRLARAFTQIKKGETLDNVILGHGYESHSGFREAFTRTFRKTPGQAKQADCLWVTLLETELGPMLAAANETSLFYLEFADKRTLAQTYHQIQKRFSLPLLPGDNALLKQLRQELKEYFQGKRHQFTIPLHMKGTPFQKKVWSKLQNIPYGKTVSYEAIARQLGVPKAVRAVARANATNPICLIVPCHRVIGKNGSLSGYACGIWRKRLLLELEKSKS